MRSVYEMARSAAERLAREQLVRVDRRKRSGPLPWNGDAEDQKCPLSPDALVERSGRGRRSRSGAAGTSTIAPRQKRREPSLRELQPAGHLSQQLVAEHARLKLGQHRTQLRDRPVLALSASRVGTPEDPIHLEDDERCRGLDPAPQRIAALA